MNLYLIMSNTGAHPGKHVVWAHHVAAGGVWADEAPLAVCDTLAEAREAVPPGHALQRRDQSGDPVIVEVWL